MYREGGARAFWRGNGANVLKVVPETAVKFAAFDALKQVVAVDPGNATTGERFVAGGVAGAAAQAAIYPLEIVKTRMALSSSVEHPRAAPTTISGTFRSVLAESGARGLFRGLAPSLVGIVPYAGIDLMANSSLREDARRYQAAGAEPGIPELLGCGMASSTTAMLATYPLNVIRTRMQTGGMPGFPAYKTASRPPGGRRAAKRARGSTAGSRRRWPRCSRRAPSPTPSTTRSAPSEGDDAPQSHPSRDGRDGRVWVRGYAFRA